MQRDLDAALEESSKISDDEHEKDAKRDGGGHVRLRSPSSPDTSFDYAIPPSLITHASSHHNTTYLPQLTDPPEEEDADLESSDDELLTRQKINRQFSGMALDNFQSDRRFFGKSSSFMIVKAAVDLKKDYHPDGSTSNPAPLHKAAITFPPTPGMSDITYLPCGCPDYGSYHPVSCFVVSARSVCDRIAKMYCTSGSRHCVPIHLTLSPSFSHHRIYFPLLYRSIFSCITATLRCYIDPPSRK